MTTKKIAENPFLVIMLLLVMLVPNLNLSAGSHECDPSKGYCLLAPLDEETKQVSTNDDGFSKYLQKIINIAISLTGILSVIMLIFGGIEYVSSSVSETAKKDAKERITNALFGLLITLSGYLILSTINPDLLSLKLPEIAPLKLPAQKTPSATNDDNETIGNEVGEGVAGGAGRGAGGGVKGRGGGVFQGADEIINGQK